MGEMNGGVYLPDQPHEIPVAKKNKVHEPAVRVDFLMHVHVLADGSI